ncbi:glycosyltransferase family 39 protein [Patescibacteria group bacterium]|nr:glycosyltransferase family 39 protein [Patescibacteria group bacterium]
MSNRLTNFIAALLLIFVFFITIFSMKDDSATMDEVAHLPSGYSYLTQKDMRLNPEHPPLIKDLSALPLLFIKGINFPQDIKNWKEDINGQWGFGYHFLYKTGNPADQMIFWGRIPMILILILLGFYIFLWTKELFGNKAALISLFLFSFSPTFLAHGKLVTTDVGAAAGVFIATYYFVKFLKNSSKKNLIIAGISLGLAQLAKFSVIFLFPCFGILILAWAVIKAFDFKSFLKFFGIYLLCFVLILVIAYLLIWPVYQYHVLDYPKERQVRDTEFLLSSFGNKSLVNLVSWMADKPILRPYAQYLLGLFLVLQRGAGGHTTYFLGEISATGWRNYFPIVYIIKEPLAFHILTILALLYISWLIKRLFWVNTFRRLFDWLKNHFPEFAMLCFIGIYWTASLISNLNIGVRHLLPTFPFTFILVSIVITSWLKSPPFGIKYLILGILILWQITSVISIYPHFLSYFNEIAGGPDQGFIYSVNSNLDWGQDLKRLKKWVNENKIEKIYVDYFGGGDAKYYLKEKFAPWWGTKDPRELPKGSYLAVSVTFLQGGRGIPVPGFNQPHSYYRWLDQEEPIEKIGHSIFVYYID